MKYIKQMLNKTNPEINCELRKNKKTAEIVCQKVSNFLNEIVWPPSCLWVLIFNTCPCKRIFREKNQTHIVIHGF